MAAGEEAPDAGPGPRDSVDVLRALRSATAREHERVEATLDLMNPDLDRARLVDVLTRMHGFWQAAEAGLDAWAARERADAEALDWPRRRRAALFATDLATLGGAPAAGAPALPPLADTDAALGRL